MRTWETITTREDFAGIGADWDACLATMPGANPFLRHGWLCAWLEEVAPDAAVDVAVLREDGAIAAAAPLCRRRARYYGVPVRERTWIGNHTADRVQFLLRDDDRQLADALWSRVRERPDAGTLVHLEEVPDDSVTAAAVRAAGGRLGDERSSTLPWVDVRDWEAFERGIPRKFRSELRTRVKVFAEWGDWRQDVVTGRAIASHLPAMAELEAASAKGAGGYAFLADPRHRRLLENLLARGDEAAGCVLFRLAVDDALVAYLFGFVHGGSFCAYNMAYRPGHEKGSPGKWLFHEAMRWASGQGLERFDFLRGASYMKSRWRPSERRNCRLVAFGDDPLGRGLHGAVFRLRPLVKRMLRRGRS